MQKFKPTWAKSLENDNGQEHLSGILHKNGTVLASFSNPFLESIQQNKVSCILKLKKKQSNVEIMRN